MNVWKAQTSQAVFNPITHGSLFDVSRRKKISSKANKKQGVESPGELSGVSPYEWTFPDCIHSVDFPLYYLQLPQTKIIKPITLQFLFQNQIAIITPCRQWRDGASSTEKKNQWLKVIQKAIYFGFQSLKPPTHHTEVHSTKCNVNNRQSNQA